MPDVSEPRFFLRLNTKVGALQLHLSLNLAAAWTVIFGPSGSGKTTVLRAACGLLQHADVVCVCDEVEFDGDHTSMATPDRRIAYAPQGSVLFPHLTVRENVAFARRARGEDAEELVEQSLELFELKTLATRMPRDLSGGERQRVTLARAFAVPQPRLMLLDEPFTGIGRAQRDVILPRIREWTSARGLQVISVTHDVEEAFLLQAEVVRLEAGSVLAQGPAELVLAMEREEVLRALQADDSRPS